MKIEEAIKTNKLIKEGTSGELSQKAIQLGIEALERLNDLREHEPQTVSTVWNKIFSPLPSEDKQ